MQENRSGCFFSEHSVFMTRSAEHSVFMTRSAKNYYESQAAQ